MTQAVPTTLTFRTFEEFIEWYPDGRGRYELIEGVIWLEDGVWCGSVPALPRCHTWGESEEHLLEMLKEAIQGWLEVAESKEEIEPEKHLIELSL